MFSNHNGIISCSYYKCVFLINFAALFCYQLWPFREIPVIPDIHYWRPTTCQPRRHCWVTEPAERQRRIYERLETSQVTSCSSTGGLCRRGSLFTILGLAMNGSHGFTTYYLNDIGAHTVARGVLHDFFQVESHKGMQVHEKKCKNG